MSSRIDFKLDLLNKRRNENEDKIYFKSTRNIISKGFLIGSSFLLIIFISCLYNSHKKREYQQEIDILQKDSKKYDTLILKSNQNQRKFNQIRKFNNNLALSISGLSSGSALISELSNLVPKNIFLTAISSNDSNLILKGQVDNDLSYSLINAFLIKLESSPFLKKGNRL